MIEPHEIDCALEPRHREAMLDLVLAWGSLDGALGVMLSRTMGIPFDEGAALIGKLPASARFVEMRKLMLASPDGKGAAQALKTHKKAYERYSKPRNRVAHSHCAGVWEKDRDFVVFATFERVGADRLAIDAVPLDEMHRATIWGRSMARVALAIADVPYADAADS